MTTVAPTGPSVPRSMPPHEEGMREAIAALRRVLPPRPENAYEDREGGPAAYELSGSLQGWVERMKAAFEAGYGVSLSWHNRWGEGEWREPRIEAYGEDGEIDTLGILDPPLSEEELADYGDLPYGLTREEPLNRAGRYYRRECGWDFAPVASGGGEWLLYILPVMRLGPGPCTLWRDLLVGFVVCHDRDEDGEIDSVAHIWTAKAIRRQGVASALLKRAHEAYPIKHIDGPATNAGLALLAATGYVPAGKS